MIRSRRISKTHMDELLDLESGDIFFNFAKDECVIDFNCEDYNEAIGIIPELGAWLEADSIINLYC